MKSKAQQELEFTLAQDKLQIKNNRGLRGIIHRHKIHKQYNQKYMTQQFANSSAYIPPQHKYSRLHRNQHKSHFKKIYMGIYNWLTTTKNSKKIKKKHKHKYIHIHKHKNNHNSSFNKLPTAINVSSSPPSFIPNNSLAPVSSIKHVNATQNSALIHKNREHHTKKHRVSVHSLFNTDLMGVVKLVLSGVIIVICILFINETCNSIGNIAVKQKQHQAIKLFDSQPTLTANLKVSERHQHDFIDTIAQSARKQKTYKIAPSLIIAQAIQESSWGKSKLYTQDHNAFGVKGKYYGHYAYFETQEDNGGVHNQLGMFKQYPDLDIGVEDHNKLLYQNYLVGIPKNDYVADAIALQKNGYATDPHYAQEIMNIVQENHLTKFD